MNIYSLAPTTIHTSPEVIPVEVTPTINIPVAQKDVSFGTIATGGSITTRNAQSNSTYKLCSLTFDVTPKTICEIFNANQISVYNNATSSFNIYNSGDDTTLILASQGFVVLHNKNQDYLNLIKGWNLVSLPQYSDQNVQALKDGGADIVSLYRFESITQTWEKDIKIIPAGEGFWVNITKDVIVSLPVNVEQSVKSSTPLPQNWNLIGIPKDTTSDAIIKSDKEIVYIYQNGQWMLVNANDNRFIPSASGLWINKGAK